MAVANDDFNRADGGLGSNWTNANGALEIVSNEVSGNSSRETFAYWNADSFSDDQYAELTITSLDTSSGQTDYIGVSVRNSGSPGNYSTIAARVQVGSGFTCNLQIYQAGTRTLSLSGAGGGLVPSGGWQIGDRMRLEVEGTGAATEIRIAKNGVVFYINTNPSGGAPSSGSPGLASFRGTNGARGDDWEGGDITGGDPAPSITSVDGDDTITSDQTGWDISGTDFDNATVEIRQGTTTVGQTVNSQNATTINCDTVFDSGATDLRYGAATLAVVNGDEQEDTIAITLAPPSGLSYVDLTTPNTTAANRITAVADLASGDQLEISNVVGTGAVTVAVDATFTADEGVTAFDVRAWDASDSTWGAVGTQTVTDITEASLDVTESPDTANVSIGTLVTGTLSATEGRDAAAFTVELLRVASMGATEPRDVLNASVDVLVISTFAVTEPSDSIAASSYLITSLVVNAVEAVDTASITSDALISVNLNITEARDNFSASIGRQLNILIDVTETVDVVALSVDNIATGMLSSVESTDQLVAAVEHLAIAAMGVIESRDVFSGTIGSTAFLNFSAVEPTDTIDVSVDLINAVELSVNEQSDTLASNVNVVITYVLTATEPNDIASISLDGPATLSIELIEQADTISILIESAGLRMDAIEPLDTFSSSIENIRSLLVGLVEGSDSPSITFETGYVYSEEWASAIALAHRMINKKGRFANVQRLATTVTDSSKPWKGTSPATIAQSVRSKMVFLIHEGRRDLGYYGVDEEMLRRVEQIVLIAPGPVDLTNFNAIEDGSVRYIVEWQRVLRPGDSSLLYVFGVKR